MDPRDQKLISKLLKADMGDHAKRPNRKMDKFDKVNGLGPANKRMLKEQMKGLQKLVKGSGMGPKSVPTQNVQKIQNMQNFGDVDEEGLFELDVDDFALDPKIISKLKLDADFFDKIDDDFEDDI